MTQDSNKLDALTTTSYGSGAREAQRHNDNLVKTTADRNRDSDHSTTSRDSTDDSDESLSPGDSPRDTLDS